MAELASALEVPAAEDAPVPTEAVVVTPNYFEWREVFPELKVLIDNYDIILEEANQIMEVYKCAVHLISMPQSVATSLVVDAMA